METRAEAQTVLTALLRMLFPPSKKVTLAEALTPDILASHAHYRAFHAPVATFAPLLYREEVVRTAVHAAKFHGSPQAAELLGKAIAPFLLEELSERHLFGVFREPVVIPIPLHPNRYRERGFNQADRMARALVRELGFGETHVVPHALARIRYTKEQATLEKHERAVNVHNAFEVTNAIWVTGKDILLVDDVVTTGSTLKAARKALLAAGAREVLCVAAAH